MLELLTLDGLAPTVLLALFFLAMLAGFVDSIAGGGGLLVIPVLFAVGLTPAQVFGTSKLGACFGSFSASMTFIRRGEVQVRPMMGIIAATFIGSVLGALTLQVIDAGILRDLIPFLLIAIALYMLLAKNAGGVRNPSAFWARLLLR
ncbi:TSUP family transporter [Elstera litoralis]|uniref:TSUP family transporter n=1 Tax=Elstera litoralis TaxID=552518 RepID=UPI0022B75269|nr:TSUP family transporter [Elstera litoralis]